MNTDHPTISQTVPVTRRDFLKLKSFLLLWFYFLQSFDINIFDKDCITTEYTLLDKLLKLPFSTKVAQEISFRVSLQKKYSTDANGNLIPLNRFIREITHFIVSSKDFKDFKLLNSIKDRQLDYNYMFICTAKLNNKKGMKYLQKRVLSYKDNRMLNCALEYAIKSKSFDTTLHLMQQNIKLDKITQAYLLDILHDEEYREFYKMISNDNRMILSDNSARGIAKKVKMTKEVLPLANMEDFGNGSFLYRYLTIVVKNSLIDLLNKNIISDFSIQMIASKVYIAMYATGYPIDLYKKFEEALYHNGFSTSYEELVRYGYMFSDIYNSGATGGIKYLIEQTNKYLYEKSIDIYDFINIEAW